MLLMSHQLHHLTAGWRKKTGNKNKLILFHVSHLIVGNTGYLYTKLIVPLLDVT